jgi:hypothetical protein
MHVWFHTANKPSVCASPECGKELAIGSFIVSCGKKATATDWHVDCLVEYSKRVLDKPKTVLGRKRMQIDDSTRKERVRLLKLFAANQQRIRAYQGRQLDDVLAVRLYRLRVLQQLLVLEMEHVGGAPAKWIGVMKDSEVVSNEVVRDARERERANTTN